MAKIKYIFQQNIPKWIRKIIPPVSWFIFGALVGITVLVLWFNYSRTTIASQNCYDPWQLTYYLFSIMGSIGTVMAVIVALAKESIMKWLYKPRLNVTLEEDGVSEFIRQEQRVPEATSYRCYVSIENIGSITAMGCKVNISDIKDLSKKKPKLIKNAIRKQLFWTSPKVDVPVGIPSRLQLFEIKNPNIVGTPNTNPSTDIKPKININGCNLNDDYRQKGKLRIDYYISSTNGDAYPFSVTIEWNGEFKSRATDMKEVLNVTLN